MINPQIEVLSSEEMDSTEVGRIVPIYEAIGHSVPADSTRDVRGGAPHRQRMPDILPEGLRARLGYPRAAKL